MSFLSFKLGKVAYNLDLAAYLIAPFLAVALIFYFGERSQAIAILVATLLGFVSWTFLEYSLHRFVLHHAQPFKSWHGEHHQNPTEAVGTPTVLSLLLIVGIIFAPAVALAGWQIGGGFATGLLIGYSIYTWVHHGEHHWHRRGKWFRKLKRAHAIHHYAHEDCNYGVITSFWDRLFGTYCQK
ncbi:sterol desaturase family protein [Halothiobacillus sp.]|uniref:sterol desaturase family protein n=1 Tax=Halothiobacillus sp. TaxID=1891311 RepID=UPI0026280EC6|nr:sterol desaturase family protein [Halothiobacillus sp.]MDD4967214.1 sterol desaturase family protein [Halothiobacillus sp.]